MRYHNPRKNLTMIIIVQNILFLLLQTVSLNAVSTCNTGLGSKIIMERMHRYAKERNLTNPPTTKWITQPLDHFDAQEKRTWKMRYLEYLELFVQNGPVYLYIGGEWEIGDFLGGSALYELAKETQGAVYYSEHRYYGQSMPLDLSVVGNLKHLSSKQALADLANLIKNIKSQSKFKHSKVVAVGASYAANLAAWMRTKYPELVDCAWASSAPVLAKKDFFEYFEQVADDFKQYGGNECYEKITQKFSKFVKLLQTAEGIEQLKHEQGICENVDMTKPLNKAYFFSEQTEEFAFSAQFGSPAQIKQDCDELMIINDTNSATLEHMPYPSSKVNKHRLKNEFKTEKDCHDYEFNDMSTTTLRSWIYQTCTEFGYYQTTDSSKQPFSKNLILDFYIKMCSLYFGQDFNEQRVDNAVARTNEYYGGLSPNVTKVIFVHGSMDPWHRLGITRSLSNDVPALMIEGTSHCRDLDAYSPNEPEGLTKARKTIMRTIKQWLGLGSSLTITGDAHSSI